MPLRTVTEFVTIHDMELLRPLYPTGGARIWGLIPKKSYVWENLSPGDLGLFTNDGVAYAACRLTHLLRSQRFAAKLWGYNGEGVTWEYVTFITPPTRIVIPYSQLNPALDFKERYWHPGSQFRDVALETLQELGLDQIP